MAADLLRPSFTVPHSHKVARQRRSLGLSWGHDLTPSAVRALESGPDALGEECAPSLMRLKRR